jgi:predicted nucleotidyltransferase component of viral defense system
MIDSKSFTKEWLDNFRLRREHKGINVTILEKMVHALSLLEHLKIAGLDFVFKGGTSLVLLLQKDNRFSIDIDIISRLRLITNTFKILFLFFMKCSIHSYYKEK